MGETYLSKFGIKKLKPKQSDIIESIKKRRDTIGILPTGYGKSITYQLPHLMSGKNVIVVCPLISLMEDQKNKLESLGIETYVFNGSNSSKSFEKKYIVKG